MDGLERVLARFVSGFAIMRGLASGPEDRFEKKRRSEINLVDR